MGIDKRRPRHPADSKGKRPRHPADPKGKRTVKITIGSMHMAVVDPPVPELLPQFQYRRLRTIADAGPYGPRHVFEDAAIWKPDLKGRMGILAGMVPRALAVLKESGYRVEVEDQRAGPGNFLADPATLRHLGPDERELVEAVGREPLGQIEVAGRADALEAAVLIAYAHPQARIAFAFPTRREVRNFARSLRARTDERVSRSERDVDRHRSRLLVTTIASLPGDPRPAWEALILPGVEYAITEGQCGRIGSLDNYARRYACVVPGRSRDEVDLMRLEAVAGPVIGRYGPEVTPVTVVMVPTPRRGIDLATGATALEFKRTLWWRNSSRNRRIVRVATAVVDHDRGRLQSFGIREELAATRHRTRVAIVVESTEHARILGAALPGWTVCAATSPDGTAAATTSAVCTPARRIVTMTHAQDHGIRADVIIRATGTDGPLRIGKGPGKPDGSTTSLVIDFCDHVHATARSCTTARIEDYHRRGMIVESVDTT